MFVKSFLLGDVGHAFLTDFLQWGVVMVAYNLPELLILAIGFSRLNVSPMALIVPSVAIAVLTQMILIMVASFTAYGFLYFGFITSAVIGTIALLVLSPPMKRLSQQRRGEQAMHPAR